MKDKIIKARVTKEELDIVVSQIQDLDISVSQLIRMKIGLDTELCHNTFNVTQPIPVVTQPIPVVTQPISIDKWNFYELYRRLKTWNLFKGNLNDLNELVVGAGIEVSL